MSVSRETVARNVSRETLDRLDAFVDLLTKWNPRINLVSRGDTLDLWTRHIRDSLELCPLLPDAPKSATDLGSGGGFPGLVLAITTGIRFTLVEADARKAAFLREAARVTAADISILNERAETLPLRSVDLVTARALAPLTRLLELAAPILQPGGTMIFSKGAGVEAEIAEAERAWTLRVERHISSTGGGGVILRISEVKRA